MNPIALRYRRRIYAYACGRCLTVPTVGGYLGYPTDANKHAARVGARAEEYKRAAAACCLCGDCKTELEPGTDHGRCDPCEAAHRERMAKVVADYRTRDARREAHNQATMASVGADADAAAQLAAEMSEVSETYYCAGWLDGLEFSLWSFVTDTSGEPHECIRGEVSRAEVESLRTLSQKARGWWRWDDDIGGEVFVPLAEWERLYAAGP